MKTLQCTNQTKAKRRKQTILPQSIASATQRHTLIFGPSAQARWTALTIGIGSVGGLGSELVEKIMRLFPKKIVLIDSDTVSHSNLNRLPGATHLDAKQAVSKALLAERQILTFNPHQRIEAIQGDFLDARNQRRFRQCDIVLSAFDRAAPRLAVNQLCQAHGVVLLDCGVGAVVEVGELVGAGGQVVLVRPAGGFCLLCSGIYSFTEARGDFMPASERREQERLGYVRGANVDAPQVYALNAMVAAQAVWLLQQLVAGWDIAFDGITIDAKSHTMRTWTEDHTVGNTCPICGPQGYAMRGDSAPLLTQTSGKVNSGRVPKLHRKRPAAAPSQQLHSQVESNV